MFLCNTVGLLIIALIGFFHLIGIKEGTTHKGPYLSE